MRGIIRSSGWVKGQRICTRGHTLSYLGSVFYLVTYLLGLYLMDWTGLDTSNAERAGDKATRVGVIMPGW